MRACVYAFEEEKMRQKRERKKHTFTLPHTNKSKGLHSGVVSPGSYITHPLLCWFMFYLISMLSDTHKRPEQHSGVLWGGFTGEAAYAGIQVDKCEIEGTKTHASDYA